MSDGAISRERPALIGRSAPICQLREEIARAAKTDYPVLVLGERGTGKELVAYELHCCSSRSSRKLLSSNVGALETGIASSELFGHVKNAFTGAYSDRDGLFRAANGGTLFLDEIGNAGLDLQGRLLRAVEYGEVTPVGMDSHINVDVRVIAATNKDLDQLASEDKFLLDLRDRFTIQIQVPPLRDCDDRVEIAEVFLAEGKKSKKLESIRFSQDAIRLIQNYDWPGNVRELMNRVRRAISLVPDGMPQWEVPAEHLGLQDSQKSRLTESIGSDRESTLADIVLSALLKRDGMPVLDQLQDSKDLSCPGTLYIVDQLDVALTQFMETEAGKSLLRSKPNGSILAELFNLPKRTDSRKKSFARIIRDRLNDTLDFCRKNCGAQ